MSENMNEVKWFVRRWWTRLFDPFWTKYYLNHRHAPRKFYLDDPWMLEHWDEDPYDPICFPLAMRINCLCCTGCSHMSNPPLGIKLKGPYEIMVTPLFTEQYEALFGKDALFELLWDLEKHNQQVQKEVDS